MRIKVRLQHQMTYMTTEHLTDSIKGNRDKILRHNNGVSAFFFLKLVADKLIYLNAYSTQWQNTAQNITQLYTEIMYLKCVCLFFESVFTCNWEFKIVPFGSDHVPCIWTKTCTLSEQ